MSMSSRDYEEIALAVASVVGNGDDYATREEMACRLADRLARLNPRFDRGRFLTACGFGN